jgi:hypothetical protein
MYRLQPRITAALIDEAQRCLFDPQAAAFAKADAVDIARRIFGGARSTRAL